MHNSSDYFAAYHHAARHHAGGGSGSTGATITTQWKRNGVPIANHEFDYFVFSGLDGLVTSGTATTSATGYLTITLSGTYAGETLQVFVNDLGDDLVPTGKIHGQQVATAV